MRTINIPIKDNPYDVIIGKGLIKDVKKHLDNNSKYVIITDENIPEQYVSIIQNQLDVVHTITLTPGENTKSIKVFEKVILELQQHKIDRKTVLIALGGGVIGDFTGFVASVYLRGINYIQIPTSLLSQVDSSVGGKVAINTPLMKNGIGSFKQPLIVLIDPDTLKTLEKRHFNNGMAEVIKHALIDGKALYKEILKENPSIEDVIYYSVSVKKEIVLQDVKDQGIRNILNLGHTLGHAIEQHSQYKLLHGESIAIGMAINAKGKSHYNNLIKLLKKYSLPVEYDYKIDDLKQYILLDKKVVNETINYIDIISPGNPLMETISMNELLSKL